MKTIELDGARGEGGGQILRTALTLSMITGVPFRIVNIRGKRPRPGLLRQHLTAVSAAGAICHADVSGAEIGSPTLAFAPGAIEGGDYRFAIGSAGSCTLVLQTVLPALWRADRASTIAVTGGTHNPAAPPADFLTEVWLPVLRNMGVRMNIELVRHGFYPAGGGEVAVTVDPVDTLGAIDLCHRGELVATKGTAIVAGIPADVATRELAHLATLLGAIDEHVRHLDARQGPGNALMVELEFQGHSELFTAFGERGLPARSVADRVAKEAMAFRKSSAAVGEYLADQLVLPMALAGRGQLTTPIVSSHLRTNLEVIERFLPVRFDVEEGQGLARVSLAAGGA